MKQAILYFFAVICTVFFTGSTLLTPISCYEEASQDFSRDSKSDKKEFNIEKGKKLTINLETGGSIKLTGWDKDVVSVDASGEEAVGLQYEETSGGLSISNEFSMHGEEHSDGIYLDIKIPNKFNIDIETMGGDVTIADVSGKINGQTMGGDLELTKLGGEVNLTTMGGAINLRDSHLDGYLKTMGGEVNFENVSGGVKGSSMGGNVKMKNVTMSNGENTGDKVVISSMGGDIDVDEAKEGADVNTMGGDIDIRSASRFVKAKTMGGDIILRSVDGGVKATTMGGDIDVKITGGNNGDKNVTLTSMGGDITLTVPDGFPMDIDVKLRYTKNRDGEYDIKSDFDVTKEVSDKWESERGNTPRKVIHGTGKTGDGRYKVKIETINGNVFLKRG